MNATVEELEAVDPTIPDQLARVPLLKTPPAQKLAAYARLKAADLSRRGLAFYQTSSGPKEITDPTTGAALTNFDKRNRIGYDSTGEPKRVDFDAGTGEPGLSDPYEQAPQKTDKLGNKYSAPQGLPWRHVGVDPTVQATLRKKEQDQLNRETAAALAPVKAEAAKRYRDLFHATKASAKGTAEQLTGLGVPLTDELGQPTVDLLDTDAPTLRAQIQTATDREYSAPAANVGPFFGGSKYSSEAERLRTEIGARKQRALEIAEAHASTVGELRKSRAQLDEIEAQRKALAGDRLASVNARRQTAGMAAISIPGLESDPQVSSYGLQQETMPGRGLPLSEGSPKISLVDSAILENQTPVIPGLDDGVAEQDVIQSQAATGAVEPHKFNEVGSIPTPATPPVDRSFSSAFKQGIDQPLEAIGTTAEVLGAPGIGGVLRGLTNAPENYESASQRFINPQPGDFTVAGFAPAQIPRAIVEQFGQLGGSIISRAAGALLGGVLGGGGGATVTAPTGPGAAVGGTVGGIGGAAIGSFVGPFLFGALQIAGPTALERAQRNNRSSPNAEDIIAALLTAAGSGSLDAIGAQFLPGGSKAVGSIITKIGTAILGEGITEGTQSLVEQTGESIGTIPGLQVDPKQALGEAVIGGLTGGTVTGAAGLLPGKASAQPPPLPLHVEPEPEVAPTDLQPLPESWIDVDDAGQTASPAPTETAPAIPGLDEPPTTELGQRIPSPQEAPEAESLNPTPTLDQQSLESAGSAREQSIAPASSSASPPDVMTAQDVQSKQSAEEPAEVSSKETTTETPAATTPFAAVLEKAQAEAETPLEAFGLPSSRLEAGTVDAAAQEAATSPENDLPIPTDAQKEAGNYKVGRVKLSGLDISIEHPAGSKRRPEWAALKSHYGYIRGTKGKDGDHIDVFIKPGTALDYNGPVFVVNQQKKEGGFDEHKGVIGVATVGEALAEYRSNYSPGEDRAGTIAHFPTMDAFKAWAKGADRKTSPATSPKQEPLTIPGIPTGSEAAPTIPGLPESAVASKTVVDELIDKRDSRNWSKMPADFERDAVRAAYGDIKKLIPRKPPASRIAASKATTFQDLRAAVAKMGIVAGERASNEPETKAVPTAVATEDTAGNKKEITPAGATVRYAEIAQRDSEISARIADLERGNKLSGKKLETFGLDVLQDLRSKAGKKAYQGRIAERSRLLAERNELEAERQRLLPTSRKFVGTFQEAKAADLQERNVPEPAEPVPATEETQETKLEPAEQIAAIAATAKVRKATEAAARKPAAQRSAKEIKAELIQRIKEAYRAAPELTEEQKAAITPFGMTSNTAHENMSSLSAQADREGRRAGLDKVEIQIPGDGQFKIWNAKQVLADVLRRVEKMPVSEKPSIETPRQSSGGGRTDAELLADQASIQLGGRDEAIEWLRENAAGATPGEKKITETAIELLQKRSPEKQRQLEKDEANFEAMKNQRKREAASSPAPEAPKEKKPVTPQVSSAPPPPKTETLLIKPRTDGMVTLADTSGAALGIFKTADEAGKWASENGYGIAAGSPIKPSPVEIQSEESFTPEQNTRHEAVVRKPVTVNRGPAEHLAAWVLKNTRWPKSVVLLHGTGASEGLQAAVTPISKRGKPFQVTFFDTGKDGTLEPFGDVPVDSLINGIVEAQRRNFTDTREQKGYTPASDTEVSTKPGTRGKPTPSEGQRSRAVSKAAQPVPGARTAEDVANSEARDLSKVIALPKGATMLRAEDDLGRESIIPLSDLKGANVLQGAGPFRKLEAGTRDRKGNFVAMPEPVTVRTAPAPPIVPPDFASRRTSSTVTTGDKIRQTRQESVLGMQDQPAPGGRVLPSVPRPLRPGMAQDAPPDTGTAQEAEREALRTGLRPTRQAEERAVQGVQPASADTSSELQQAASSGVVVPEAPFGTSSTGGIASERESRADEYQGESLSESDIRGQLLSRFGLDPARDAIRILNNPDGKWDARAIMVDSKLQRIEINAAKMRSPEQLERAVIEELAHGFTEDPDNAKATQELMDALTPAERAEIDDQIEKLGYGAEEVPFEQKAKAVRALVSIWNNRTWFKKLLGRILAWARKAGLPLTRLSAESLAVDAALRTAQGVRAKESAVDEQKLEAALSSRGVRGDKLLDALDLARDLQVSEGRVHEDGTATVYHRTTQENAQKIVKEQAMIGKEDGLFFGTHPTGQIEGYGDAVVAVRLPLEKIALNDVFSGEAHVRMNTGNIGVRIPVKASSEAARESRVAPPAGPLPPGAIVPGPAAPTPPNTPPGRIDSVFQRIIRGGRWFWEGASDTLDRAGYKDLAAAIRNQFEVESREFGETWKPIREVLEKHPDSALGREDPIITKAKEEFSDYFQNRENGRDSHAAAKLPTYSAIGQELIAAWKKVAVATGARLTTLGVEVQKPDGSWRPIGNLGEKFFPRKINQETLKVLNEPDKYPAEWTKLVNDLIANGNIKTATEAQAFLQEHVWHEDAKSDYFANIEKARTGKLPESWLEYKFDEIAPWYTAHYARRMGQIEAYGQEHKGGDLFDKTLKAMPKPQSWHTTQEFVKAAKDAAYMRRDNTALAQVLRNLQTFATGAFLTNPMSAIRNVVSGVTQTAVLHGPIATLKASWQTMREFRDGIDRAHNLGVLRTDLMQMMVETRLIDERPISRGLRRAANLGLNVSGFNLAERFSRTVALTAASNFARDFAANPAGRKADQQRAFLIRHHIDPAKIIAEGGSGAETNRFIRNSIRESQGGYKFDQTPLYMAKPEVGFLMQFGKWGTQMTRMWAKHAVNPAIHGTEVNGKTVRTFAPLLYSMAFAIGGGELLYFVKALFTDREPPDASLEEIGNALTQNQAEGVRQLFNRAASDVITAGTLGMLSDYAGNLREYATRGRFRNPFDPPGVQAFKNVFNILATIKQQRTLTAKDVRETLLAQFPGVKFAEQTGKKIAGEPVQKARNVQASARQAGMRMAKELGLPVQAPFTSAIPVKSPKTPFFTEINEALLAGDAAAARKAKANFLVSLKTPEERKKASTSLATSVSQKQPISVGGIEGSGQRAQFLQWAKKRLPASQFEEISALDRRYWATAREAGIVAQQPQPKPSSTRMTIAARSPVAPTRPRYADFTQRAA